MKNKKKITIVTPTFNEEENIILLYNQLYEVINFNKNYDFEILVIDNSSTDKTIELLRKLASNDFNLKVILNTRNFGHIRSPYWGILSSFGDAVVYLASDLQDPPSLINNFIKEWEKGWKVVLGVKPQSKTNFIMHRIRIFYYYIFNVISDIKITKNSTGFGLYDKAIINHLREINDPYPFFRGLIAELGFPVKEVSFTQNKREKGISKNNIYTLYDNAILGFVSHSNIPLRISSFFGYLLSFISIIIAFIYMILKVFDWYSFPKGIAPLIVAVFFLFSILFIILGIISEYIAVIYINVRKKPIIIESERINF